MFYSVEQLNHFSGFSPNKLRSDIENASGLTLVVGFNHQDKVSQFDCSFDYESHHSQNTPASDRGYSFHILHLLQDILMFKVKFENIQTQTGNKWDFKGNRNIDIIVCHPPLDSFSNDFDSLFPTLNSRLVLLYQSSGISERDLFLANITGNIWFYLLCVFVLLAFCFRLSTYAHHCLRPKHSDWSWLEVAQWTLGAICQQGSAKHPQGCSCRTMFLIGYCITYMIYTGFAAGITSLLAARTHTQDLHWDNVLQLDQSLTALCNSQGHKYLKLSTVETLTNVKDCLQSEEELIETLKNSESTAVMLERNLERIMAHFMNIDTACQMSISKESHHSHFSGFALKKNSPLKPLLNYWLLRLKEHGLLKRWLDLSLRPPPECQAPPGYMTVGYSHVKSAFVLFLFHIIAAVVIFLFEIVLFKYGLFLSDAKSVKGRFNSKSI